jgi:predicted nuclease of predicted toxin-antitoxin system
MKLLIDSNLSWRLIKLLENDFPECLHVNRTRLQQPPTDRQIFEWAKSNNYSIVSYDDDFHHLSLQLGFPPKIILIKTGNLSTMSVGKVIMITKARLLIFFHKAKQEYLN